MAENDSIMCPSHRCKPGSRLLGIRQEDGTVAILPTALPIDQDFIDKVTGADLPAPEQRFRFTNKCVENGCNQWTGKGCGVVEQVVKFLDLVPANEVLPACSIRPRCRWFLQKGKDACKICPYIPTEVTGTEVLSVHEKEI